MLGASATCSVGRRRLRRALRRSASQQRWWPSTHDQRRERGRGSVDGGTQGLYLIQHVAGRPKLLIFDAIDYGLEPGTLKLIENDEVPRFMGAKKMSLHQTGFQEVLSLAQLTEQYPDQVLLIGCQPRGAGRLRRQPAPGREGRDGRRRWPWAWTACAPGARAAAARRTPLAEHEAVTVPDAGARRLRSSGRRRPSRPAAWATNVSCRADAGALTMCIGIPMKVTSTSSPATPGWRPRRASRGSTTALVGDAGAGRLAAGLPGRCARTHRRQPAPRRSTPRSTSCTAPCTAEPAATAPRPPR